MQKIIKTVLCICVCFMSLTVIAQKEKKEEPAPSKKNVVKINLPALLFKNISVEYERQIGKKTSVSVNVHTIPFSSLPFQSTFNDIGNTSDINYDQFKLGSFGVVPELRFYLSKKGALHGFYIGPFVSYSSYKMNLPVSYTSGTASKTGIFDGKLNTFTGGIQFGSQFSLGKNIVLDWWIFGPNYGSASGTLTLSATLTAQEQTDLRNQLEDIKNNAPLNTIKSYSVNSTGASVIAKGPWAGLRGAGLCLGIRL